MTESSSSPATGESFWTLPELLKDLDSGDYLYLTPSMCTELADLIRKAIPSETPSIATVSEERLKDVLRSALGEVFENIEDMPMGQAVQILVDALRDLETTPSAIGQKSVWAVISSVDYEGDRLEGILASKEEADAAVERLKPENKYIDDWSVQEWKIGETRE
jgi:hypothetical protein